MRLLLLSYALIILSSCSSRLQRERSIPQQYGSTLIQNYQDIERSGACGSHPVMRFVDFEYIYNDSLIIDAAITTSLAEESINGNIDIITDEYNLAYKGNFDSKQYHETMEVEANRRYPQRFITNRNLINTLLRMSTRGGTKRVSGDQNWNNLQTTIEHDDVDLLLNSQEIKFRIMTQVCTIEVWPSQAQVRDLRNFLRVNRRR